MENTEQKTYNLWEDIPYEDESFDEGVITKVEDDSKHKYYYFDFTPKDTTYTQSFSCPYNDKGIVPKVGSEVVLYGLIGRPVRGLIIDDKVVYYRTEDEQMAKEEADLAIERKKQAQAYARKKPKNDEAIAKLPQVFQDRITGFRERRPGWGPEFEDYELMCCQQAVVFAETLKNADAISAWYKLPEKEQMRMVPGMHGDHSGNTFGTAARLAIAYLDTPDLIPKMHGAMCPLVGCVDYGCWVATNAPL
jgi:hypothetical protein